MLRNKRRQVSWPASHTVNSVCSIGRCALFIYLEVLLVSKILFQLPLVSGSIPISNEGVSGSSRVPNLPPHG